MIPVDAVPVRTDLGTARMRDHAPGVLTPKLRAVLFLVNGEQTTARLIERAGRLGPLLASQLEELAALGLIAVKSAHPPAAAAPAAQVPPILGAKLALIGELETLAVAHLLAPRLAAARGWHDLAHTAREVYESLEPACGADAARGFWARAKVILTDYRARAA